MTSEQTDLVKESTLAKIGYLEAQVKCLKRKYTRKVY